MSTIAKWNDIATDFPISCPNFVNIRDSSCATSRLTSTIRDSSCATPRLTYTLCVCIVSIVELKPMVTEVEEEDVDVVGERVEPSDLQDSAFLNAVVKVISNVDMDLDIEIPHRLRKFPALHDITYAVLPCVGNDAYGPFPQGELVLPLEAYDSPSNALTIIQQRSPVIKLGWKKLQEYDPSQKHWKYLSDLVEGNATLEDIISVEDELEEENYYASLPFAALFSFLKAKGLKVTCLLCYCSEGDNILDAFQLADAVCKLHRLSHPTTGIEGDKWRVPLSWMSVYGPPPDLSIF
ncbi:hypothetical protein Fmac_015601 [Flemingia macrophylla]|uniref:Proteasome assembly chaperone 2 n=1 Tax=Flemingia macrophylla TaxID=520843 RepID=A0ABD1MF11_9FABA